MDNLDDMMKTASKKSELLNFLEHFCETLKSLGVEVNSSINAILWSNLTLIVSISVWSSPM